MRPARRSRKIDAVFLIMGVIGVAIMVWLHSKTHLSSGLWWMWVVLLGIGDIGLGLFAGWTTTKPRVERLTTRQRSIFAGCMFVLLTCQSTAQDTLGTYASPWFEGLTLFCLSVGFYAFIPLSAHYRRQPTSAV